jgi:hypothetical protein
MTHSASQSTSPHLTPQLFAFEVPSSENLAFIPLSVRFHLDRHGLRISLADWQGLPLEVRTRLASYPVEDESAEAEELIADIGISEPSRNNEAFAAELAAWMLQYVGHPPVSETPPLTMPGEDIVMVPDGVIQQCTLAGLPPVATNDWVRLTRFQRYALAKLSRKTSANHDFLPAMKEFGLDRS